MPANLELQLVSLILELNDLRPVLRSGLKKEMLAGAEARAIFSAIMEYYRGNETRNLIPTRDHIIRRFQSVDLPPAPVRRTTMGALCKDIRDRWVAQEAVKIMEDVQETLDVDPDASIGHLLHDMRSLVMGSRPGDDIILAEDAPSVWERYKNAKTSDSLQGIPFPRGWGRDRVLKSTGRQDHPLNEQTRGIQDGQLIIFYGRPKSMKTWTVVDIAAEAHAYYNCRVLFFTKEMRPGQVEDRIVAREAEVNYAGMRQGDLPFEQEALLRDIATRMAEEEHRFERNGVMPSMLITPGWGEIGSNDIDCLYAKAAEFEPDLIIADAAYLMEEAGSRKRQIWESVTSISRSLKKISNSLGVPVVATTQANRAGEEGRGKNVSEIAYSDAFGQDCDMAVRVIKQEGEEDDPGAYLDLLIPAAREITLAGLRLHAVPAEEMSFVHTYESQRKIQEILEADARHEAQEMEQNVARRVEQKSRVGQQMQRRRERQMQQQARRSRDERSS